MSVSINIKCGSCIENKKYDDNDFVDGSLRNVGKVVCWITAIVYQILVIHTLLCQVYRTQLTPIKK